MITRATLVVFLLSSCVVNVGNTGPRRCSDLQFPTIQKPVPLPLDKIAKARNSRELDNVAIEHMKRVHMIQNANYELYNYTKDEFERLCKKTRTY